MPTVGADVRFSVSGDLPYREVEELAEASLARVGLGNLYERPVASLSGGQKQRVAIAGVLAQGSKLLLLDELTTFLDAGDQDRVLQTVRALVDGKGIGETSREASTQTSGAQANAGLTTTALWVTHRLKELDWADGAILVDGGRIVCVGSPEEVRARATRS
eukprot:scaffold5232_cov408-Prasinococcus_capsulatus_cf.AAC.4